MSKEAAQRSTSTRLDQSTADRFKIFFMRFARLSEQRRALVPIKITQQQPSCSNKRHDRDREKNPAALLRWCRGFFLLGGEPGDESIVFVAGSRRADHRRRDLDGSRARRERQSRCRRLPWRESRSTRGKRIGERPTRGGRDFSFDPSQMFSDQRPLLEQFLETIGHAISNAQSTRPRLATHKKKRRTNVRRGENELEGSVSS